MPICNMDFRCIPWVPFGQTVIYGYKKYGRSPAGALKHARIVLKPFSKTHDLRMTMNQWLSLLLFAMKDLDDEGLGLAARRLPGGTHSMLVRASLGSPNLSVALKRWIRHHNLMIDDLEIGLTLNKRVATISVLETHSAEVEIFIREVRLFFMLTGALEIASWLVGSQIPVTEMTLPFPKQAYGDVYSPIVNSSVCFAQKAASISFDIRYLERPMLRNDDDLKTAIRQPFQTIQYRCREDGILTDRVHNLLAGNTDTMTTADAIADALNISRRTLCRRLQEEGTSLQALKDEARHAKASHLLMDTLYPTRRVASMVGFSNERSFARAFKHWSGDSPAVFRHRQGGS